MKKLLFLIAISILFNYSYGQIKELPIKLEIKLLNDYKRTFGKEEFDKIYPDSDFEITGDSAIQKYYDIEIIIYNDSPDTIYIWLMSCSWINNFIINNDYMFFDFIGCDHNKPISLKINPRENKIFNTALRKHIKFDYPGNAVYGFGVETTRLGLVVVNDIYQKKFNPITYSLGIDDKSKWIIIWSNPLPLHQFELNDILLE